MITKFVLNTVFTIALKVLSLVIFLITIMASYAGHVNPELWALPSILSLPLPYFAGATLILTLIWVIRRKIVFSFLGVGTILLCMPAMSQAFPISFPKKAEAGEKTFKLLTWNILHTQDQEQPDNPQNRAITFLTECGADIICLQEMDALDKRDIRHWTPELEANLRKVYPYEAGIVGNDGKILSKYPLKMISNPTSIGHNGRDFLEVEVNIDGHKVHILNVHLASYSLTSEDKEIIDEIRDTRSAKASVREFKASVLDKLKAAFRVRARNAQEIRDIIDATPGNVIVCGDFNDVPTSWTYRTVRGKDLEDAYAQTSFGPTFTYNAHHFYFHIDQILYRGDLKALSVKKEKIRSSDHYPLMATFAFPDNN